MHYLTAKSWGVLKQRMGATVPARTSIGAGAPCRQNRINPRPGIEPGLQEPESDANPTEPNRFGTGCNTLERLLVAYLLGVDIDSMAVQRVMTMLHELFCKLDTACEKNGVYKVETIGDVSTSTPITITGKQRSL